ncbi:MAG: ParB/RepB/Spo0J family partition protein [Brevibacterium yomogidense]
MAEKRRGLGRGLGSLIPSQETGRPSDVFFPRSERADPDAQTESQETEREKVPSDPAESMRRAQAGRKTGSAKRTPAKGATQKPAASKSAATKATSAATKSGKSSSQKSADESTSASAEPATRQPATKSKASAGAKVERGSAKNDSDRIADSIVQSNDDPSSLDSRPTDERTDVPESPAAEASDDGRGGTDTSVDGVYVSRETVRSHSASEEMPGVEADAEERDAEVADVALSDSSAPDVPRETGDEQDDAADLVPVPGTTFGEISLDRIRPNPRQPRDVFDEDALDELITSIREIGVLQPVVVRRRTDAPGQYELIMGERRFRASKEAGKDTIPAIVRETSNDDLLRDALLENLHRVDLNPLEEAAAYAQLLEDFNCTQEELSERIGRSRPQISNTIRLLKLPGMVQRRVAAGVLSSGHARALLGLNDGANMEVLAQRVVAEGLSVRATEEAVILLNRGDRSAVSRGTREPDPELAELARSLGDRLDTRVNVVMGKRKGKLSVEFANGEDLNRILLLLGLEGDSDDE